MAVAERNRSPNYPVISLGEAIARVRTIYEKQHTHAANRDVLAKLLGYGGVNGASASVVSALSKYGLLEGHGDNLRVSALGQDLALHKPEDPEYCAAIQQAAFLPPLFRELHDQYPNDLPSEHSLRVQLIKQGFNPKSVDGVIRVYRDTLDLVDAHSGDNTKYSTDDGVSGAARRAQGSQQGPSTGSTPNGAGTMAGDSRVRAIQLPYSVTEWATLQAAFPLTEEAWEQMLTVLNAMKPALVKPSDTPDLSSEQSE